MIERCFSLNGLHTMKSLEDWVKEGCTEDQVINEVNYCVVSRKTSSGIESIKFDLSFCLNCPHTELRRKGDIAKVGTP